MTCLLSLIVLDIRDIFEKGVTGIFLSLILMLKTNHK